MLNKSTFLTFVALFFLGSLTYAIKQKVIELDGELSQVHRGMAQYQESMHILNAEWAYLTRPSRLQALVEDHTRLHQSQGVALVSYEDVFDKGLSQCDPEGNSPAIHLASMKDR